MTDINFRTLGDVVCSCRTTMATRPDGDIECRNKHCSEYQVAYKPPVVHLQRANTDEDPGYKTVVVPDRLARGRYYAKMRRDAGITQRQLADHIGRLPGYISDLECGRRNWPQWVKDAYRKHCKGSS